MARKTAKQCCKCSAVLPDPQLRGSTPERCAPCSDDPPYQEGTMTQVITRRVRIKVRTVGQGFGCEGVILARNGRELATTSTYPHDCRDAAREAALDLAASRGWEVAS